CYSYWPRSVIFVVDANFYTKESSRITDVLNIIRNILLFGLLFNDKDVTDLVFANTNESVQPYESICLENIEMPHVNANVPTTHTPPPQNWDSYTRVLHKAVDLKHKEVDSKLIPMFLSLVNDQDMQSFVSVFPVKLRDVLFDRKIKQSLPRPSLGDFKLSLCPDLSLLAQYFNYFQKDKKTTQNIAAAQR
uniref:Ku70/Ku80 N-terminal alpha/beta domain-containing protein n=1 Tax=Glossina palpalis gambiensis TaxID=67801 RepID=A0A1B0BXM5_9MUSC